MNFPIYKTKRIVLDKIDPEDNNDLFEIFSNIAVTKYYDLEAFTELNQADRLIELLSNRFTDSLGIRWAIRFNNSDKCIGTCGFNSWNEKNHSTVIGYDLIPEHWNKGIITEAVNKIISAAFSGDLTCKEINRIQADTVIGNTASEAVLNKLGFKEEGTLRQSGYWKGSYHDLKCFSLLKNEHSTL